MKFLSMVDQLDEKVYTKMAVTVIFSPYYIKEPCQESSQQVIAELCVDGLLQILRLEKGKKCNLNG